MAWKLKVSFLLQQMYVIALMIVFIALLHLLLPVFNQHLLAKNQQFQGKFNLLRCFHSQNHMEGVLWLYLENTQ